VHAGGEKNRCFLQYLNIGIYQIISMDTHFLNENIDKSIENLTLLNGSLWMGHARIFPRIDITRILIEVIGEKS